MFEMRPASVEDQPEVGELIRARAQWMRERGMPGWEGWHEGADTLAAQAGDEDLPVWVLVDSDAQTVVGVTSVYDQASPLLWPNEAERQQPSIFLATTVTHPAYTEHRPGCLIAWWALDLAARQDKMWVRRGTGPYEGLVRYYRDVQGWRVARTVQHNGVTAYALERRAEPQPHLTELGMRLN